MLSPSMVKTRFMISTEHNIVNGVVKNRFNFKLQIARICKGEAKKGIASESCFLSICSKPGTYSSIMCMSRKVSAHLIAKIRSRA